MKGVSLGWEDAQAERVDVRRVEGASRIIAWVAAGLSSLRLLVADGETAKRPRLVAA
jgi:hypothetical protein